LSPSNILITGLPRSGTTLTCELLSSLPDTVALDEPLDRRQLLPDPQAPDAGLSQRLRRRIRHSREEGAAAVDASPDAVAARVAEFIDRTRESALQRGVVRSKSVGGKVMGAKVSDERDEAGLRVRLVEVGEIAVGKPLTPDFVLAIKQCGGFTAVLETLAARFPVYALVRNPLSVLRSWRSVPMPIRDGRVPLAERLNPDLARALDRIGDPIDRQFHLLTWFYGSYQDLLPFKSVVAYEKIIATGGRALEVVCPAAAHLDRPLEDRNRRPPDADEVATMKTLGGRLLDTDGPWWKFYTPAAVAALVDGLG